MKFTLWYNAKVMTNNNYVTSYSKKYMYATAILYTSV